MKWAGLRIGDYHVERCVLVERKRVADFAISLIDGRLFRQTAALAAASHRAVLLLEGDEADWHSTAVRREAVQGALITIGVFNGLALLRSFTPEESARLLVYIGGQAQRFVQGGLPRPGDRPKGRRARQLFFLQGLPGLGPERAARLLDRFGSARAIMTALIEQLVLRFEFLTCLPGPRRLRANTLSCTCRSNGHILGTEVGAHSSVRLHRAKLDQQVEVPHPGPEVVA